MLERIFGPCRDRPQGAAGSAEAMASQADAVGDGASGRGVAELPRELLASLDRAAHALGELGRNGIALGLEREPAAGELRVVVTRDGSPSGRTLSARELLDLLDGGAGEVAAGPSPG